MYLNTTGQHTTGLITIQLDQDDCRRLATACRIGVENLIYPDQVPARAWLQAMHAVFILGAIHCRRETDVIPQHCLEPSGP